jgi:hypothetical protein
MSDLKSRHERGQCHRRGRKFSSTEEGEHPSISYQRDHGHWRQEYYYYVAGYVVFNEVDIEDNNPLQVKFLNQVNRGGLKSQVIWFFSLAFGFDPFINDLTNNCRAEEALDIISKCEGDIIRGLS